MHASQGCKGAALSSAHDPIKRLRFQGEEALAVIVSLRYTAQRSRRAKA